MGNSNSHGSSTSYATGGDARSIPPHSWAYSFPRSQYFRPPTSGPKVLPAHVPGQQRARLRPTENGSMLHTAGTINGKRPYEYLHRDDIQHGYGYEIQRHVPRDGRRDRMGYNMYTSEPDLRFSDSRQLPPISYQHHHNHGDNGAVKGRMSRSKKKYRAPQVPPSSSHHNGMDSSSPDSYQHWENHRDNSRSSQNNGMPRLRLFKTRAETKRKISRDELKNAEFQPEVKPQASNLHRSMSSPQFQAELKRVTERLREKEFRHPPVGRASESSSNPASEERTVVVTDSNKHRESPVNSNRQRLMADRAKRMSRSIPNLATKLPEDDDVRCTGEGSSATGSNDESKSHDKKDKPKTSVPDIKPKTFYFGMNEFNDTTKISRTSEDVDRFAESFNKTNASPSDSITSSDPTDENGGDISLQLRPTLPRKQFDIPRFSPTAAWRLLTALESPSPVSPNCSGGEEDLIPIIDQPHNSGDKSGDSGISGDASPNSAHNSQVAWTPQQDLEETSSDGGLDSAPVSPQSLDTTQFSRTRTIAKPSFCLSLPRDESAGVDKRYGQLNEDFSPMNPPKSHGYFKSKLNRGKASTDKNKSQLDENWVLSRSVPDSLHQSGLVGNFPSQNWNQLECQNGEEPSDEELAMSSLPKFSYLAAGRRAMYLPEYKSLNYLYQKDITNVPQNKAIVSKSCEDLTRDDLEDEELPVMNERTKQQKSSSKKFAFQSTIRQIERKKIAEKLSKEAEYKERQRLSEMEAMRRVEEEFQRKREREKADIRQQLRLYTLTQGDREPAQPLPSGTQVLSEFRESRRDYKDFNSSRVEHEPINHSETPVKKSTTVHPKVVYQMPKSTPVYVTPNTVRKQCNGTEKGSSTPTSGNYRRDFAQGALPHSVASSDSEVSVSITRPTSRSKHRSRSASPISDRENNDIGINLDYIHIIKSLKQKQNNETELNEVTNEKIPASSIVGVNSLQPFMKNKNSMYKPIVFNPINKNKFAQPLM
ncbi:uncharacterized protein LOC113554254 [Rhopalosiphum maidis]|uniref:uncharacterized protein LOC113554254 n=1 Tax=Rhopalosiphum maidis TaxID=43146 RepID=UPI000EFFA6E8|nr:uncharacterized protein LOC113554254 [Rhopalosiphum maidis]XP_026813810.1 uncharacterized protein LOC113554254 [Rhopalosiphum maidis]XP_026813811.1 uncharacterized protein LOC113554254 [Rhopalosiphum maidis]